MNTAFSRLASTDLVPVRILLIKLSALGDVIQTLPTLEAIRAVYPAAEISWLVEEDAAPVLACHPALDNLLISRRQTWLAAWRHRDRTADCLAAVPPTDANSAPPTI